MKKQFSVATIVYILLCAVLAKFAQATTYIHNDKEISKGQAMKVLLADPNAKVLKVDQVILNEKKMVLKVKPKDD